MPVFRYAYGAVRLPIDLRRVGAATRAGRSQHESAASGSGARGRKPTCRRKPPQHPPRLNLRSRRLRRNRPQTPASPPAPAPETAPAESQPAQTPAAAPNTASQSAEPPGSITEDELRKQLEGKDLFLRGGYLDNTSHLQRARRADRALAAGVLYALAEFASTKCAS